VKNTAAYVQLDWIYKEMKDMPSAAQTGGSTEPNGCVLKHEKEELMDTSSPQQDVNDVDKVTISF